ncbi:ATP-binding SpoIIE family protein phosphatase [Pedococcus sp. KACC 23699]|uniref:ATP-binding SpoIIE family protein phosphatase n=1 Tax=Pedococcus sp. KACC 23699 TaxID=3149228 RepID=A0AAU7JR70_9MICO
MVDVGTMGARALAAQTDWSRLPTGAADQWPPALLAAWDLALDSLLPTALLVGKKRVLLYNDAFAERLGSLHPAAFGRPADEVLPELWDASPVGGLLDRVLTDGDAFLDADSRVGWSRPGGSATTAAPDASVAPDAAPDVDATDATDATDAAGAPDAPLLGHHLRTGSAVRDAAGDVVAVVHVVVETSSSHDRARAVAELASALGTAVTVDDVCKVALREAVAAFDARSAGICLPSPEHGGWRIARRHRIEDLSPDEERLPLIWSEVPQDLAETVSWAVGEREVHRSDSGELVVVPLETRTVRAAIVGFREATELPASFGVVLSAFTDLVAEALGRAVVYDAERSTAELLQRTLLPPSLPQSDAISVAARYEPVSEGTVAGGDFYDSFFLPDGRLALVIGDVVGRGVMAATVMGQVRAAVRGAALADSRPNVVMGALDRVVWDLDALWPASLPLGTARARPGMSFGGELFVTMLYATITPETGVVEIASAGHPVPALLSGRSARADGAPRGQLLTMPVGPPLGIGGARPATELLLEVGDMLVAYTDGLLERRGEDLAAGEERLLGVLADLPPSSPRRVAQLVMEAMVPPSGQEDDCAVLTVGRSPAGYRRRTLVVPPMPESVRAARDWARAQLTQWHVGDADQYTIVTGISELITNAVLHAGTESHLTMDLDSGQVSVTVADSGNRGEPLLTGGEAMAVRGRGLSLVKAISDAFGSHRTSAGTTVWFEVVVTPSHEPQAADGPDGMVAEPVR